MRSAAPGSERAMIGAGANTPSTEPQSAGKNPREKNYSKNRRWIDFERVNSAAVAALPSLLARWLPSGRREGFEYVALNPTRCDRHLGSFRINLRTGAWGDFATGDSGGDPVSLAAYLSHLRQIEAAQKLGQMLGLGARDER